MFFFCFPLFFSPQKIIREYTGQPKSGQVWLPVCRARLGLLQSHQPDQGKYWHLEHSPVTLITRGQSCLFFTLSLWKFQEPKGKKNDEYIYEARPPSCGLPIHAQILERICFIYLFYILLLFLSFYSSKTLFNYFCKNGRKANRKWPLCDLATLGKAAGRTSE